MRARDLDIFGVLSDLGREEWHGRRQFFTMCRKSDLMRFFLLFFATITCWQLCVAETTVIRVATFDDRVDLSELSQEIGAHDIASDDVLLRIGFSYGFDTLEQAEAACDLVSGLAIRAAASGTATSGNCTVSLHGIPTVASLVAVREAVQPVADLDGATAQGWLVLREVNPAAEGKTRRRPTI